MADTLDANREYTGGPESVPDTLRRWMRPRGGPVADGIRLAALNSAGLAVAIAGIAVVALITRLIDSFIAIPALLAGFFAALVTVGIGAWGWHRYGRGHGLAARARGSTPRADVFAAIGAAPFVVIASSLLGLGLIALFFAAITFSGSRLIDALRQLGFSALFVGVAALCFVVARASSEGPDRGAG